MVAAVATLDPEIAATHKRLMTEVVLVEWGKRAGKAYAKEWNDTVGKVVGLSIPLDKL